MLAVIQRVLPRWIHHSGQGPGMGAAPVQPAFEFGLQLLRKGVQPASQAVVQPDGHGKTQVGWTAVHGQVHPAFHLQISRKELIRGCAVF